MYYVDNSNTVLHPVESWEAYQKQLTRWGYRITQCAVYTCHYYAGSIPERDGDKLYNTCTVFNPDGELIAK